MVGAGPHHSSGPHTCAEQGLEDVLFSFDFVKEDDSNDDIQSEVGEYDFTSSSLRVNLTPGKAVASSL